MKGLLLNNKYYGIKKSNVNYGILRYDPLYFIALEDNSSVGYQKVGDPPGTNFSYSYDNINWISWDGTSIALNKDDLIYVKGYNPNGICSGISDYLYFTMSGKIRAQGDINSLLYIGYSPTEQLPINCYYYLFKDCTSLVYPPSLPSLNLSVQCYRTMFYNCTSLVQAPELPATIAVTNCYDCMFYGCTSLVTAPDLPATTLARYCYSHMFRGCSSLINAPELPATTLINYCYYYMFAGCTSLVNAPELPATTLVDDCYGYMFYGCTSLNYVKTAFTGDFRTSTGGWGGTYDYTTSWLSGVSSIGDFYYNGETIRRGVSAIPTDWTVHTF